MSLLTLIQNTCRRVNLTVPNAAAGSTDENIVRLVGLANEEGRSLSARNAWQVMVFEATHTTLAAESQGLMTAIAGASFGYIVDGTFWNRTQNRPWIPVSAQDWQRMKSNSITGPRNYFRIRGGYLIALPTPTAGQTLAFEWVSRNWCESSGGTGQSAWAADTDVGRLDEQLMEDGLVWRWKKAQGLEYAEDFNEYEIRVANAIARDGVRKVINFGALPAASNVPEGSWSL